MCVCVYCVYQAFIQALLSTAVFPQGFSFFTVCLVHYLHEVPPWWAQKTFWNLGLQFAGKCISNTFSNNRSIACASFVCSGSNFSWNFRVKGSFDEKLTRRVKWKRFSFKIEFVCMYMYVGICVYNYIYICIVYIYEYSVTKTLPKVSNTYTRASSSYAASCSLVLTLESIFC